MSAARRESGRPRPLHDHPRYISRALRRIAVAGLWLAFLLFWLWPD